MDTEYINFQPETNLKEQNRVIAAFLKDSRMEMFLPPSGLNSYQAFLKECLHDLSASPAAQMLLRDALKSGWEITAAPLNGYDFQLDVCTKMITLDHGGLTPAALKRTSGFRRPLQISLIRALRDVWQENRHGGFEDLYNLDSVLMLERVRAADLDVLCVLIAWELRGTGNPGLWRTLVASDNGDMAIAFSRALERDPAQLYTGCALGTAFSCWYEDENRIRTCDHETLNYIDTIISEESAGQRLGRKMPTPVGVEILSCLPDKTAYLKGKGREILSNPFYAGLNDPINQAHYLQISRDLDTTYAQGVTFRDAALAEKIFPAGLNGSPGENEEI